MIRRPDVIAVLVLMLLFLSACAPQPGNMSADGSDPTPDLSPSLSEDSLTRQLPEPTASPSPPAPTPEFPGTGPWDVTLEAEDGAILRGRLFGQSEMPFGFSVVLAPMYPGNQEAWYPFAQTVADHGYQALTFDFRGYGASGGVRSAADMPADLASAVTFLREHGSERIMLIGAVQGGMAAIRHAAGDETIAGLAVISSARTFDGLEITDADLAALTLPSLWVAARVDMNQRVEEMFDLAGGSDKQLWIYEGSSLSGTYIFEGADGADLERRLLEFIEHIAGAQG